MATAIVLCIGTELTRGELVNSNGGWLAAALTASGFQVTAIDTVDDDASRIVAALTRGAQADVLVATGGLGPTTDDITTACVAAHLNVPLERDAESLSAIRTRVERRGASMSPSNEKQADFPKGAHILPNPHGTAPGFSIRIGRASAFFLPGVPREMAPMFESSVKPGILPLVNDFHEQIVLRTYGLPESEVNERLQGVAEEHAVMLGYRATIPVIEVKVLASDRDRSAAEQRAAAGAQAVRERLGSEIVFAEGDVTFAEALGRVLMHRGWRLSTAESCTGGLLAELLTARSGASRFFLGGAVTYDNGVKSALLGVPSDLIAAHGAVSAEVARAMAQGALTRFEADVALGITGVAGPDGGSADKPVGLVHYAAATRDSCVDKHFVFTGDRELIRLRAAYAALGLVWRLARAVP